MPVTHSLNNHQCICRATSEQKISCFHLGLLIIPLTALIATSSDIAIAGSTLTAKQIRAEIIGKWITVRGKHGNQQAIWRADGKALGRLATGGSVTGTWKFKGNRVCTRMKFRNYREVCGSVRRSGKGYIWGGNGAQAWVNK